jgi:hypothetical protein
MFHNIVRIKIALDCGSDTIIENPILISSHGILMILGKPIALNPA